MNSCNGICNDCRNLVSVLDSNTIQCEAYMFSVKCKNECKGYLSCKCKNQKLIHKNNKVIADMYLEDEENRMFG